MSNFTHGPFQPTRRVHFFQSRALTCHYSNSLRPIGGASRVNPPPRQRAALCGFPVSGYKILFTKKALAADETGIYTPQSPLPVPLINQISSIQIWSDTQTNRQARTTKEPGPSRHPAMATNTDPDCPPAYSPVAAASGDPNRTLPPDYTGSVYYPKSSTDEEPRARITCHPGLRCRVPDASECRRGRSGPRKTARGIR